MAMFNDLFEMLADIPLMLVGTWVAWLATGVLIVMWFRRAALEEPSAAPAPRPVSKPKPVSRPASSPDLHSMDAQAADAPVGERAKGPVVIGDPFGDLATLLDQPARAVATEFTPPAAEPARAPADSPILSSAGSPIRRVNSHD